MKTVSLRGAAVEPVKNSAMSVRSSYSYTEQLSAMQTAKQLRLSVAVVSHAALPAVMAEVQGLGNTRLPKKNTRYPTVIKQHESRVSRDI